MHCPKCKNVELTAQPLSENLESLHCDRCQGDWLSSEQYQPWQDAHSQGRTRPTTLHLERPFTPSEMDSKAGLCPECRRILSRVKIPVAKPFYLERCSECNGFWCDDDEWDVLRAMDLDLHLDYLFTPEWQHQVREQRLLLNEKQALIQKLGADLAHEVFQLAEHLASNDNGDFAVAYLARQVSEVK